jgi:type I restriction-modification system DNA methylase subunit
MIKPLGRYYTSTFVSDLLVSRFRQTSPGIVLDLGAGRGSLLTAAYKRWKDAEYYAVDIDRENISASTTTFSFATFRHIDGLSPMLSQQINLKVGSIDVAVCNPPYHRIEKNIYIKHLLVDGGLPGSIKLKRITSDVVFLARNLQMLKQGGELGIILPDGIFTSREFFDLRKDLLENHTILGAIQLPDNVFKNTEARTHILLMEKGGQTLLEVPLYCSDKFGNLKPSISISPNEALRRMDYSYYKWKYFRNQDKTSISLIDTGAKIMRGRNTRKYLEDSGIKYFHTTSFLNVPREIDLKKSLYHFYEPGINAKTGDILLARVGKRCIGKVALVRSGSSVVTDCIYLIRVPDAYRESTWKSFISREGQDWLNAHAHGVCSQCLSKVDLLSFPIFV